MSELYRKESDSIGTLDVPADAYYGVQSLRGYRNFSITGHPMNLKFMHNVVKIKKAAAVVNAACGAIPEGHAKAIVQACDEALEGKLDSAFITDAIQGGAGTTANMNANEVIANRATEILGGKKGEYICHPNDHVNNAQSTNDVIPSAGKLTVLEMTEDLLKELDLLIASLKKKAVEFDDVLKMGRTQLEDAVPIRLGQEFTAYASALERGKERIIKNNSEMHALNMGGTAIGTAVNVKRYYLDNICKELSKVTGFELSQAADLIDATQNVDSFACVSGALKALAISLSKMSNDLRLLGSGPRTGIMELNLPAMQNGSSIMPGKVNPVIPEVVSQVAFAVIGNDMTIAMGAEGGQLELNAFEPVIFYKLFESLECLTHCMETLRVNCIDGLTANREVCEEHLNRSVGIVTALCPYIGYKKSAELAKEALKTNVPIKELVLRYEIMSKEQLDKVLDPIAMTEPEA